MRLGIMQPYFMPYLGYFSLIKHTDRFILFDTVQFIRHGWIERNRILKPGGGWQYFQVPLIKGDGRDTLIRNVRINNDERWKEKILAQVQHYKKTAPFYFATVKLLKEIFSADYENITSLNKASLEAICSYLGFERELEVFSKMGLQVKEAAAPDEWALNICEAIPGADEYWNPPGGQTFFDRSKYDAAGVKLRFQEVLLEPYDQWNGAFEGGLSVVDALMFNSPAEVDRMLDNFNLK